jgi:hypothetical protein
MDDRIRSQHPANMKLLIDVKLKVEAASQLRDSLEHYTSGPIYPAFLKKLIPIFINILKGQPVFISTSNEQVCSNYPDFTFYVGLTPPRNSVAVSLKPSTASLRIPRSRSNRIPFKSWTC